MQIIKIAVIHFLTLLPITLFCQTGQLSGKIIDAQTQEPLPSAYVFVSNTTIGTTSDVNGNFILKNIPTGINEMTYSYLGYQMIQRKVTITEGQNMAGVIKLTPTQEQLATVQVTGTRDKEWLKKIKKFEKQFFGENHASACKIKNPWVIDFSTSADSKTNFAKASAPIEIVNTYLGYSISFHLNYAKWNNESYLIDGKTYFRELTDSSKISTWAKNRASTYWGSDKHLYMSILNGSANEEGFRLYIDNPEAVHANYRSDLFYSELGKNVVEYDVKNVATPTGQPYEYAIRLKGRVEVHYINKAGEKRYYKDMSGAVSWIETQTNRILVNNNGIVLNPSEVIYSGEMSNNRVASMLPLDYQPKIKGAVSKSLLSTKSLQIEKAYTHTDKDYYYPGETIWMKTYINSSRNVPPDSSSRVLYLELINQGKEIVLSKTVEINNGWAASELNLPFDLPAGNYLLRGYTNWMRNFGEQCFSLKPLPILNISEKIESEAASSASMDSSLQVVTNKKKYRPHEEIHLSIHVQDENKLPKNANLSVAVTDAQQVTTIKESETILTGFLIPELPNPAMFAYPAERGITVSGVFTNDKLKPESTNLRVILGNFENFFTTNSYENGKFSLRGLQWYDSSVITFQAINKRGKPYGKVSLTKREIPLIRPWAPYKNLVIVDLKKPQRTFSEFELPKNTTVLKEVIVKGKRVDESVEKFHATYGKPDQVVSAEELANSGSNLVTALQGKIPLLRVEKSVVNGHYFISLRGQASKLVNAEPLVFLDGMLISANIQGSTDDTSGDILARIDPKSVARIEFTTRSNGNFGQGGQYGAIAIFTKASSSIKMDNAQQSKMVHVFKISGYNRPSEFKAPDYNSQQTADDHSRPDNRSTIYWNPLISHDKLSFFAADRPGKYRVIIEGVSETGEPLRYQTFIEIEGN
jgi:hypothetical protein